ncbi:MAG: YcxB family protein [Lachnospiraceae bacterium]|nr:YcxB family protein [Robinsoniella sp.]MDY3767860.1 YcxB family protein [Lachnospiraceae bacterium]
MEAKFEVKMSAKKMFHFLMYHAYHSVQGPLSLIFAIAGIGLCIWTYGDVETSWSVLYGFFGILFLVYEPVSLYMRAATQVKLNPAFKKPLSYVMDEEGITTMQGDQKAEIKWNDLRAIKESKAYFFCYTSAQNAFIFPKKDFKDQQEAAEKLLRDKKRSLKDRKDTFVEISSEKEEAEEKK